MACNCRPVRKPYSERTHDEEWQYPPCQCKGQYARSGDHVPEQGFGELTPAQIERLKRDNAEALRPSWLATKYLGSPCECLRRAAAEANLQSEAVLALHKRIASLEDIVSRMHQRNVTLDAPEQFNAKDLPKHASELKSGAVLVTYDATVNGITERRSVRVAPGVVIELPMKSRVISVAPES